MCPWWARPGLCYTSALKHCGSCGSITYHCWENPTACLSRFTLIPYCLWRPALVKSTSHPGPKPAQVSRPMCIASLLRVWALQALLPWPLLPENGIQMGKIPKTSLRGDLAELEGSFSLKKEKKNIILSQSNWNLPQYFYFFCNFMYCTSLCFLKPYKSECVVILFACLFPQ